MKEFLVNGKIGGATSFVVLAVLSAFVVVVAYMLCRRLYESLQQKIGHAGKKEKAVDIHAIKVGNPRLAFCKRKLNLFCEVLFMP